MSIAKTGPATAAALTPGSSQTVRRPAMPVVTLVLTLAATLAMVSLAKQVYLISVLFNERNPKSRYQPPTIQAYT